MPTPPPFSTIAAQIKTLRIRKFPRHSYPCPSGGAVATPFGAESVPDKSPIERDAVAGRADCGLVSIAENWIRPAGQGDHHPRRKPKIPLFDPDARPRPESDHSGW